MNKSPKKADDDSGTEVPEQLAGLNTNEGLKHVSGKKKLYRKILNDFLTQYSDFSDTLTNAFQNNDMDNAQKMVHKIKGVSGTIGAYDLHNISKEIDSCLKNGELDELDKKLSILTTSLQTVIASIDQLTKYDTTQKMKNDDNSPSLPINELVSVLMKVGERLSQARPGDAKNLYDTVIDDLVIHGFEEDSQELIEKIDDLEYKEARDMLTILADRLNAL